MVSDTRSGGVSVRVLIVADQPVVREGLASLFEAVPAIGAVESAAGGNEALCVISRFEPHVVLLDTALPNEGWAALVCEIKDRYSAVRVLLFTDEVDDEQVSRAVAVGADGVMVKTAYVPDLLQAIVDVAHGRFAVDANLGTAPFRPERPDRPLLSERETEVLRLVAAGLGNKEIAAKLYIATGTAKRHVENISHRLGVSNRTALVAEAFRRRLLS